MSALPCTSLSTSLWVDVTPVLDAKPRRAVQLILLPEDAAVRKEGRRPTVRTDADRDELRTDADRNELRTDAKRDELRADPSVGLAR